MLAFHLGKVKFNPLGSIIMIMICQNQNSKKTFHRGKGFTNMNLIQFLLNWYQKNTMPKPAIMPLR